MPREDPRGPKRSGAQRAGPGSDGGRLANVSLFGCYASLAHAAEGGGAIRGIGEKITVNPASGTGGVTIPIHTSPGRAGFHPELALAYESGNGNVVRG